jgi:hypothetical protein
MVAHEMELLHPGEPPASTAGSIWPTVAVHTELPLSSMTMSRILYLYSLSVIAYKLHGQADVHNDWTTLRERCNDTIRPL